MASDTDPSPRPLPASTAVWVGMFCLAWMLPGLIGHDPWKPVEAVAVGYIHSMLTEGAWLIPHLAGEAVPNQPPLLLWVCAAFAKILGGLLPLHDAARVGVLVFVGGTVGLLVLAARNLYGAATGLPAFLLILGCIGFIPEAHQIVPDLATVLGYSAGICAFALAAEHPKRAGILLGFAISVAFLGGGLVHAAALAASALSLPLLFGDWRTSRFAAVLGIALITGLPACVLWLWALAHHSPEWLSVWSATLRPLQFPDINNLLNAIGSQIRVLSWHTWPLWPLAAWALWAERRTLRKTRGPQVTLVMLIIVFVVSSLHTQPGDSHRLPLIVPLTVLAAQGLLTLRRGASHALLWFSVMFFLLFALTGWFYWMGMDVGYPDRLHRHLMRMQPGYDAQLVLLRTSFAAALTAGWLWILLRMKRAPERPVLAWTAGATMLWGVFLLLFGNYMDTGRSYRAMSEQVRAALPSSATCVGSAGVGASQRAMLHYFGGITTERAETANARRDCPVILIQTTRNNPRDLGSEWKLIFSGARLGDKVELYQLFAKTR